MDWWYRGDDDDDDDDGDDDDDDGVLVPLGVIALALLGQATLIFYFVYAFVESDISELGKMTHSDIWRMISSFSADMAKAISAPSSAVFTRTFVPAVVSFLQQYLSALDTEGA